MRVVILDGSPGGRGDGVAERLALASRAAGAEVSRFRPGALALAPCQGDFDCWVTTPGVCRADDEGRDIARAVHDADVVVYLTPLTFGGYAWGLKRAVDRLIGLVEPFFQRREGLTHHSRRYQAYPAMLFVGWEERPGPEAREVFAELTRGNALNLCAPWTRTLVVSLDDVGWPAVVEAALRQALAREGREPGPARDAPGVALAAACAADATALVEVPRSVTLLVGSARPRGESTSESLGRALLQGLERAGVATRVVHAVRFLKEGSAAEAAVEEVVGSDLRVVSSPLYVDTLPALATRALEAASARLTAGRAPLRSVVGLLNCGFPEAVHNRTAMRVVRAFARQSGLAWAGGLAMGAGEAVHGRPLAQVGGLVRHQVQALALAGEHLARGQCIPPEASAGMARALVPAFLYRWLGTLGWAKQGRAHGVSWGGLQARPLDGP